MLLRGKLAVVAGFGAGMPRRVAVALAREGADLVVFGGDEPVMVTAAGEIAALGRKALCVPVASSDRKASDALATRVHEIFGRVDVLVHSPPETGTADPFEQADLDDWSAAIHAGVVGPLTVTQALLPLLRASGDGRVIFLSGGAPDGGPGVATAAAVQALVRLMADELAPGGIRVNAVHQDAHEPVAPAGAGTANGGNADIASPGRPAPGDDEEIAGTVVFLASALGRAVSGQSLLVEAGRWPV